MGIYSSCKALIIGVSRYEDPQYDLSYARSDAEAMAELLGTEFGFDQIWTLYDKDATRQSVIRFFEQDLQRTDKDDGILVFFAGHGITVTSAIGDDRGFLVPHDGDPNQPYANLSLTTIREDYLPMIPAKHVFLVVDACYGGLALRDVTAVDRTYQGIDDTLLAELTHRDRKVRQVLAAGTKDQQVLDGGLFGHSLFTGRLIEALREAKPYITADHVGVHVRERVARDSVDRNQRQTPLFGYLAGGEGTFVFSRRRFKPQQGTAKTSGADPEPMARPPQKSEPQEESLQPADVRLPAMPGGEVIDPAELAHRLRFPNLDWGKVSEIASIRPNKQARKDARERTLCEICGSYAGFASDANPGNGQCPFCGRWVITSWVKKVGWFRRERKPHNCWNNKISCCAVCAAILEGKVVCDFGVAARIKRLHAPGEPHDKADERTVCEKCRSWAGIASTAEPLHLQCPYCGRWIISVWTYEKKRSDTGCWSEKLACCADCATILLAKSGS